MPDIHFGDINSTHGANSPITTNRSSGIDERSALQALVQAILVMRAQAPGASQEAADEFLQLINSGTHVEKHQLRDAIVKIGGVATVLGQVGVPVIQAIQKLTEAFHL